MIASYDGFAPRKQGGKLSFITDENLKQAVICACKQIRETGWFNVACEEASYQYGVSEEEVKKCVRIAQGKGQRESNARNKRKYHWYVLEYSLGNDRVGCNFFYKDHANYAVRKATSEANAKYEIYKNDDPCNEHSLMHFFGRVLEFDSKEDAYKKFHELINLKQEGEKYEQI